MKTGKPLLSAQGLFAGYGQHQVLSSIDITIVKGDFIGVLGPNGSGKTTLLRALTGIIKPTAGWVTLEDKTLEEIEPRVFSRRVAVVSQSPPAWLDLPVRDVVLLGRIPHFQKWQWWAGREDGEAISWALEVTDTNAIQDENFLKLSGGEQQRALLALALAQKPELLLLDEPTLHLDINYQAEIFELLRDLNRAHGLTILAVLHDLNLASAYCRRLIFLKEGRVWKDGPVKELLTEENVNEIFRARIGATTNPRTGNPVLFPLSSPDH